MIENTFLPTQEEKLNFNNNNNKNNHTIAQDFLRRRIP